MNGLCSVKGGVTLAFGFLTLGADVASAQKRQREVLKNDEIVQSVTKDVSLYTAIRRLRPHFFETRGARTIGNGVINPLAVYIGRNEQPIETLESILAWDVEEARYLPPSESANRFGDRANGGAVVVTLVKTNKEPPKKDPIRGP